MKAKTGIVVRRAQDGTYYVWVRTPQGAMKQQVFEGVQQEDVGEVVTRSLEKTGWISRGAKPAKVLKE